MEPQKEIKQPLLDVNMSNKSKMTLSTGNKIVRGYFLYSIFIVFLIPNPPHSMSNFSFSDILLVVLPFFFLLFLAIGGIWFNFKKDKQKSSEYLHAFGFSLIIYFFTTFLRLSRTYM